MPKSKATPAKPEAFIGCTIRQLPEELRVVAAQHAILENPVNRPRMPTGGNGAMRQMAQLLTPWHMAMVTSRWWGADGVRLSVSFLEKTRADLQDRILSHMNAWGPPVANVQFTRVDSGGDVRISRGRGGYWSYLGTDVRQVRTGPTMNLEGFVMATPESEYLRVVRHETGHTLGAPHEHMRRELVDRLDEAKTIAYFKRAQGWSEEEVRQQVLTPLEDRELTVIEGADERSIMAYSLPGSITKDGRPIEGGSDIDPADRRLAAKAYPLAVQPPPPPPGVKKFRITLDVDAATGAAVLVS